MVPLLLRWFVLSIAVFVAAQLKFTGIDYDSWQALAVAALLLGVANAVVRPLLMLVSLPLIVLTFGIFIWVVNAALLYAVGHLVEGFHVPTFGSALAGALVISLVTMFFGGFGKKIVPPPRPVQRDQGDVIDI
jgi:putative membrane protein